MIGSFSQTVGASRVFATDNTAVYASADNSRETDAADSEESKLSKINVSISNQLDLGSAFQCKVTLSKVTLKDENGNALETEIVETQDITVEAKRNSVTSTHFHHIGNGTYIVMVESDGFATFTQEIADVENEFCTVNLTAGFRQATNTSPITVRMQTAVK